MIEHAGTLLQGEERADDAAEGNGDLMTCCVGIVSPDGSIIMGADSAGVSGTDLVVRADPKIFRTGPYLMSFTSSFRMGQLLCYALTPPDHDPRVPIAKFMATMFIDAVRTCLKDGGYAETHAGAERGGSFLVGYCGHLFVVHNDYQVAEPLDNFAAVGCGDQVAHGALYATAGQPAQDRLLVALQAAERFSAGVRGPFTTLMLPAPTAEKETPPNA